MWEKQTPLHPTVHSDGIPLVPGRLAPVKAGCSRQSEFGQATLHDRSNRKSGTPLL